MSGYEPEKCAHCKRFGITEPPVVERALTEALDRERARTPDLRKVADQIEILQRQVGKLGFWKDLLLCVTLGHIFFAPIVEGWLGR